MSNVSTNETINAPMVEHKADNTESVSDATSTQTVDAGDTTSEASSTNTLVAEENNETTDTFLLRFSLVCRPFKLPKYPDVALEAMRYFEDPQISVTPRKEGSELVYRIEINEQKPKYGNALSFTVEGKKYNVDLHPVEEEEYRPRFSYGNSRENNLLLTFLYAGQRKYNTIPMDTFDNIIQKDLGLTLEKPTEKQKIKGTQIFNGNRYCVIRKPENLAVIPDSIPVVDAVKQKTRQIRINYDGKVYNCGRCMQQHPGRCPLLEEFYKAKEERERMEQSKEIKTKIISDSTLRNAEKIGLCADVMTMSGGGLGQIIQAAIDDPDTRDKSHIVLIGGANDIKNRGLENDKEFAHNIDQTISKFQDLAFNEAEKKFTLVNSHPRENDNIPIDHAQRVQKLTREVYLHTKLKEEVLKMSSADNPIKNVDIIDVEYDVDNTGHPTIEGTMHILQTLNDFLEIDKKLIWHSDFITTDKIYRGVQAIYKYGCNICNGFGQSIQHARHNNSNICDDCMELVRFNAGVADYKVIEDIRQMVEKKLENPPLNRSVSDDEGENERTAKRQCMNNQSNHQNEDQDVEMPDQE